MPEIYSQKGSLRAILFSNANLFSYLVSPSVYNSDSRAKGFMSGAALATAMKPTTPAPVDQLKDRRTVRSRCDLTHRYRTAYVETPAKWPWSKLSLLLLLQILALKFFTNTAVLHIYGMITFVCDYF